ncbi:MAG: 16S rRNA (guanine(527)-N(7))-methyltransferase RsmG [Solobacterium sp.]|nr:16S rRNA (guanine(527)-N(7))-methyltransferase RsmG [Solobacterium sp.]
MNFTQLQTTAKDNGIILSDELLEQLRAYMDLLIAWNEKFNLTAITEPEEIIAKHFWDSIIPLTLYPVEGKIADVGTGAGFPGLVWKIVRPELSVSLIEPTGKRCTFLKETVNVLHLQGVEIFNVRSEEHVKDRREYYDVVTARAVANLRVLSELCLPLVKTGGSFIAMKGSRGNEELQEASSAIHTLGGGKPESHTVSLADEERINILIPKVSATPLKYPRNYGQIKKKPL